MGTLHRRCAPKAWPVDERGWRDSEEDGVVHLAEDGSIKPGLNLRVTERNDMVKNYTSTIETSLRKRKARMEKIDKQFNSTGMQHVPVFGSLAKAMHSITASAGSDE